MRSHLTLMTLALLGQACAGGSLAMVQEPSASDSEGASVAIATQGTRQSQTHICDPNRPVGQAPMTQGSYAPNIEFAGESGSVRVRDACGRALLVVTLDESCSSCRRFVDYDAADLLRAWQQSNTDARLMIALTRVSNGTGGTRLARTSDIANARARYRLPASVEVTVDGSGAMSQLGFIGPKVSLLLDSDNRVVALGTQVDMNQVLATQ